MKKRLAAILVFTMILGLFTGCSNSTGGRNDAENSSSPAGTSSTPAQKANDGVSTGTVAGSYLTFGCTSDPKTFSPWNGGGGGRNMTNMAIYETLAYMKSDGTFSNCIMKNYTNPSDGVYVITIYDYVHDSEGNPVTADDVVFSFTSCAAQGDWATYTAAMKSIEKVDEYSVKITMDDERPDSFSGLLENVMIVSQAAYEASVDGMATSPVGTGSYVLEDYVPGSYMTYVVNENYWQTEDDLVANLSMHNVERYTVKFITDKSQQSIALETGDVYCTNGVLSADYVNFINDDGTAKDGFSFIESEKQGISALVFNCSDDSVCGDVNLRKAIAYAIDTAALAYAAYGNAGIACTSFSQTTHFDHDDMYVPENGYFTYNLETAKSYLEQSDYKDETIVLYAQSDTEVTTMCELIRAYCEAAGIKVSVETFDTTLFTSYLNESDPKWDMAFTFCKGGDYTYVSLAWCIDINYFTTGVNNLQIYDPTLQALFDTAVTVSTFSHENTKALLDYINENCYMLAMTGFTQNVIYNTDAIEYLGTTKTGFDPVPGASVPVVN